MKVTPIMTQTLQSLLSLRAHIATTLFTSQVYYHFIEALFFLLIIYLVFTQAYKPWARHASPTLSAHDEAVRLAAWKPEPLARSLPKLVSQTKPFDIEIATSGAGPVVTLSDQRTVLNFATNNFLGLLKNCKVEQAVLSAMREYGCGACGPRGFYGTTDVHLECEDAIAKFCNSNTAILYSFGSATGSSTIPAFVKRGDLVVMDDAVNYTLRQGVQLSRAHVLTFRHNDMADLRSVLTSAVANDTHEPTRQYAQRRLVIVEAISQQMGDVCPLDEVVKLKDEFRFRLLLDESLSLGVLGRSGRGALEEFGLERRSVEIATADLGNAVASVGGFCVGADDVVDHQRLSGAGYCFSASQPPFLAKAATSALQIIENDGVSLIATLRHRMDAFREDLNACELRQFGWCVDGDVLSPMFHFRRIDVGDLDELEFTRVQEKCLQGGVLVARPVQGTGSKNAEAASIGFREFLLRHGSSIRVTVSAAHSEAQVRMAARVVNHALCSVSKEQIHSTESKKAI